ncbi:alpha/beta-Hydrolases superfamily protein [Quillaja saponaria]|uniref:Alpha/beta-Hydrolases superfamily protein n=1 Tax=Quillaja saponaria TaxID=32244 RepID=A0AAD7Q6T3_QUISA|nr:alpha/beta-Hydrolases superfamily protein [Quillaja saponaria]
MGSPPHIVEDCMGVLRLYSDGTVLRSDDIGFKIQAIEIEGNSIVFKDCVYDKKFNLYLRFYKPTKSLTKKLPIIIFIHGGGFCFGSRVWPHIHNCCIRLASDLQAVVVAPDYRLAPEHRLPAAMEDAVEAVRWVQRQALLTLSEVDGGGDAWLGGEVDFDRVFIVGDSSGGNLAHHLAVRFGSGSMKVDPVRVRGYVLLAPFFGGEVRTNSEEKGSEQLLSLEILDRFWRLSLEVGENRENPMANPFGARSPSLGAMKLGPILVIVGGNELLKDRGKEYARRLKELGKNIEYVEFEGKEHGFFTHNPYSQDADGVILLIKRFMHASEF